VVEAGSSVTCYRVVHYTACGKKNGKIDIEMEGFICNRSYTSKSSFLDNDPLPEYKAEQPYKGTFSGKRIHRGLYRALDGTVINADVNGAYNIMSKGKQNFCKEELSSGLLESPVRIAIQ
jgi:transposase